MAWFRELFSYSFILRAMSVGMLVALCAALLGVSLVLKRYSMIGQGLSNVGFGALSLAMALDMAPLPVSIPIVVVAAFLLLRVSENSRIKGDAAIALISSSALAIGVIVTSLSGGMNLDVCNYMFGSILAMRDSDVLLSIALSVAVLLMFVLCYTQIFAVTFDEAFARSTGMRVGAYNMLIALLTALTIVVGMRIMGTMLISSLVIFPALTAMRVCKRFFHVVVCAAIISLLCFFAGMVTSYALSWPAGASIVAANLIVFGVFSGIGMFSRRRIA